MSSITTQQTADVYSSGSGVIHSTVMLSGRALQTPQTVLWEERDVLMLRSANPGLFLPGPTTTSSAAITQVVYPRPYLPPVDNTNQLIGIGIGIGLAVNVLIVIALVVFCYIKRKRKMREQKSDEPVSQQSEHTHQLSVTSTFSELASNTEASAQAERRPRVLMSVREERNQRSGMSKLDVSPPAYPTRTLSLRSEVDARSNRYSAPRAELDAMSTASLTGNVVDPIGAHSQYHGKSDPRVPFNTATESVSPESTMVTTNLSLPTVDESDTYFTSAESDQILSISDSTLCSNPGEESVAAELKRLEDEEVRILQRRRQLLGNRMQR